MEKTKGRGWMNAAYVCMIFLILLTFFLKIRPPIVHNGDDWAYISFQRPAMPVWHEWNPSRVLPECLLPLCAHFAVTFVMPLCHDYIWSITIVCCVVLCAIITLYLCLFGGLLRREMKLSAECTALCVLLLLIVHFRSWMSPWIPGEHLFHSVDLNNYFYYTIPVLVNACLVILFEQKREMVESFGKNEKMTEKGLLLLMIYFAVFSNMYGNCVLAIYSGICFLENIWTGWKSSRSIKAVLQKVSVYVLVLFLWCVCAIFEINGGRAAGFLGGGESFLDRVKTCIWILLDAVERMEDSVFYGCILVTLVAVLLLLFSRKKQERDWKYGIAVLRYSIAGGLTAIYLILLCATTYTEYIGRMDVLLGIMVYVLLIAGMSAAYLIKRFPKVEWLLPLIICIMGIEVLSGINSYELTNRDQTTEQTLAISRNMVQQIQAADEAGLEEMDLLVPQIDSQSNWPYPYYMGARMQSALSQHRMIQNVQTIRVVPDPDYYTVFGIH